MGTSGIAALLRADRILRLRVAQQADFQDAVWSSAHRQRRRVVSIRQSFFEALALPGRLKAAPEQQNMGISIQSTGVKARKKNCKVCIQFIAANRA